MVGFDRGAKAAADAGSSCRGIAASSKTSAQDCVFAWYGLLEDAMRCDGTDAGGYYLFRSGIGPVGQRWEWRDLLAV